MNAGNTIGKKKYMKENQTFAYGMIIDTVHRLTPEIRDKIEENMVHRYPLRVKDKTEAADPKMKPTNANIKNAIS